MEAGYDIHRLSILFITNRKQNHSDAERVASMGKVHEEIGRISQGFKHSHLGITADQPKWNDNHNRKGKDGEYPRVVQSNTALFICFIS